MASRLMQLAAGVSLPMLVATGWVMMLMQGFHLLGPPTPEERAWQVGAFATGAIGYALIAFACWRLRDRYPTFAWTAAICGSVLLVIQVVDLAN